MTSCLLRRLLTTTATAALIILSPTTRAQTPQAPTIAAGSVVVTQQGTTTVIAQSSARGIIDWRSFSIGPNSAVRFDQPGSSSVTLNRVTGSEISRLDGSLSATGQVWLSNPNGLIIGTSGQINVGGLLATTGRIDTHQFLAFGRAEIDRISRDGAIVNRGAITLAEGGYAALAAASIRNDGVIAVRAGSVALGAGKAMTIDFMGDRLIQFQVTQPLDQNAAQDEALIVNKGDISAVGGNVLLSARAAKGVIDNVINLSGHIVSNSVQIDGGTVTFGDGGTVRVGGSIDAGNASGIGGRIAVMGDIIAVQEGAVIDASGALGGGSIAVGGGWQGTGPYHKATTTTIAAGATLKADATHSGNGGRVTVWADDRTQFDGSISARGGALSGNGGAIETSGKRSLTVGRNAKVSALAPQGQVGDWLLDPLTITVATGGAAALTGPGSISDASDTTSNVTVDPATLNAAAANVTLAAQGSVTFVNAVSLANPGVSLTVNADRTFINSSIATNNGGITIRNFNGVSPATEVTFGPTGALSIGTGTVTIDATNLRIQGTQSAGSFNLGNSSVTLTNATTLTATGATVLNGTLNGAFAFAASGPVSLLGGVGGSAPLANLTLGNATLAGTIRTIGTQSFNGSVTLNANTVLSTNNAHIVFSGTVDAAAAGIQSLTASVGSGTVTLTGGAGGTNALASLSIDNAALGGTIKTDGAQSYTNAVLLGNAVLSVTSGGITFDTTLNGPGGLTLSSGGNPVMLGATGGVSVGSGAALAFLSQSGSGTVTVYDGVATTGAQSYAGPIEIAGSGSFSTLNNAISFAGQIDASSQDANGLTVNAGTATVTFGGNFGTTNRLANFTQLGTGTVSLGGTYSTKGGQSYAGTLSLAAATTTTISTAGGVIKIGQPGGTITSVGASGSLLLSSGIGTIDVSSNIGNLVDLTLKGFNTEAVLGSVAITGAIDVSGFTGANSGAASVTFTGTVTSQNFITSATELTVGFEKNATFNSGGNLTFANIGGLVTGVVGGTAITITNPGGLTLPSPTVNNAPGNLFQTTNTPLTLGAVVLTGSALFDTTGGNPANPGANITIGSLDSDAIGTPRSAVIRAGTAGTLSVTGAIGGTTPLSSLRVMSGAAAIFNAGVTTIGAQRYAIPVILGSNTVFSTTNANILFMGQLDGSSPGTANFSASLGTGTASFASGIGVTKALGAITLANAVLDGSVYSQNTQSYGGVVTLLANSTTLSATGGDIILSGAAAFKYGLGGNGDLSLLAGGDITIASGGNITSTNGALTVTLNAAAAATTQATVNGGIRVTGGTIDTQGGDLMMVGGQNGTLAASGSSALLGKGVLIDGGSILTLGNGTLVVSGAGNSSVAQPNRNGIEFGAATITTTNDITLTGESAAGGLGITLGSASLSNTNNDIIMMADSFMAAGATVTSASGTIRIQPLAATSSIGIGGAAGAVSVSTAFINAMNGTIEIGRTTLSGDITLPNGFVVSRNLHFLTGSGAINALGSLDSVDGTQDLRLTSGSGTISLAGATGATTALASLRVSGDTYLNANVTTTGAQSYAGALILNSSVTLATTNDDLRITAALNGSTVGMQTLNVAIGTGVVSLTGGVGVTTALASLTLPTSELGGVIKTTGAQSYGNTTLLTATTLSTVGGSVAFGATLDGPGGLTISAGGNAVQLATDTGLSSGPAFLNQIGGGPVTVYNAIYTSGTQSFSGSVTVAGTGIFSTTNDAIVFSNGLNAASNGGNSLTLATGSGAVTLANGAGSGAAFSSITKTGTGALTLGGNVETTGAQDYAGPVLLDNTVTLTAGGSIAFGGSVNSKAGSNHALSVTVTGATNPILFTGAVGGTTGLSALNLQANGGSISLNNSGNALNQLSLNTTADATVTNPGPGLILNGATVGGTLSLTSNSLVTQIGGIDTPNLALSGAGGNFQFIGSGNKIGTLAANTGAVHLINGGGTGLTIASIGAITGVTLTGGGTLQQTGAQSLAVNAPVTVGIGVLSLYSDQSISGAGLLTAGTLNLSAASGNLSASAPIINILAGPITVNGLLLSAPVATSVTLPSVPSVPSLPSIVSIPTLPSVPSLATTASIPSTETSNPIAKVDQSPPPPVTTLAAVLFSSDTGLQLLAQILTPPISFSLAGQLLLPNIVTVIAPVLPGGFMPLQPNSVAGTGTSLAAAPTIKLDAADAGGASGQVIALTGSPSTRTIMPGLLSVSGRRFGREDEPFFDQFPPQINEELLLD